MPASIIWQKVIGRFTAIMIRAGAAADTIPIYQVPRVVLDTAIKAANLIGKGLYGVDLKMVDDKAYVIEINDNPSIDHELEDAIIGDEMYYRLLNHFEQALEMKHY